MSPKLDLCGKGVLWIIFNILGGRYSSGEKQTKLAVVVLDFKKTYDRVDWIFLEGTMHYLGFNTTWIKGVSCLYRNALSQVFLAGGV